MSEEEEKRKVLDAVSKMYDRDVEYRYQIRETIEQDNFSRFRALVNRAAEEIANIVHEIAVTVVSAAWTLVTTVLFGRSRSAPSTSSSNGSEAEGGCFIATAVYGDVDSPDVIALRAFRDKYLLRHLVGRQFVRLYYRVSPPIAQWLRRHPYSSQVVRNFLGLIVKRYGVHITDSKA